MEFKIYNFLVSIRKSLERKDHCFYQKKINGHIWNNKDLLQDRGDFVQEKMFTCNL